MMHAVADSFILIGQLGKTYGVSGWLKVNSFTSPMENLLNYNPWYHQQQGEWIILPVTERQLQGNSIVAHIQGIDNPEAARLITGTELAIKRSQFPKLAKGEYFWCDLIGLDVVTTTSQKLGQVVRIIDNGANDLLVVQGKKEHLIPFIKNHFVLKVDLDLKQILVDWDPDF